MATWLHTTATPRGPGGRGSAPEAGGQARPCARARGRGRGRLRPWAAGPPGGGPGRTVQACYRTALQKTCASILGGTSSVGVAEMSLRFSGICEVSTAFHTCGVVRREP